MPQRWPETHSRDNDGHYQFAKSNPQGRIQTPRKEPHAASSKSTRKSYIMQELAVKPQSKFILFCFKRTPVAGTFAGKANRKLPRLGPLFTPSTITTTTTATDLQRGKVLTSCLCWRGKNGVILSTTCLLSFYPLWSNLSSSSLVIPSKKSVPIITPPSRSGKALPRSLSARTLLSRSYMQGEHMG